MELSVPPKNDGPREDLAGAAVRSVQSLEPAPKGGDQGVISRITGLSRTDTATLLLGVTDVPVALVSGW